MGSTQPVKSYFQLINIREGKVCFVQWSVTGCVNLTPGQAQSPGVIGQDTMNFVVLCFCVLLCCFVIVFCFGFQFCLSVSCGMCLLCCFFHF